MCTGIDVYKINSVLQKVNLGKVTLLTFRVSFIRVYFFFFFFLAALGLRCCAWAFPSCSEQGLLIVAARGLLIVVASRCGAGLQVRGLQQLWHAGSVVVARGLQSTGSVVVAHGLSCSATCGILPDQGLNPCTLHGRRILNHCTTREAQGYNLYVMKYTFQ